ncbi:SIS domain-containing protein [Streptomyces sp. NPDC059010]|uniref:SIS domain-containing protein n=1 Tax=Streptomyces sp. NPDC059010 TaxID=3346695 RepID=UPI0036C3E832
MSHVAEEIASQPECWLRVSSLLGEYDGVLPRAGERIAVVGCGTSWFMAQSYAALRESSAQGHTDAFTPSEMPLDRAYDRILAITRSGTTTEVLDLLRRVRGWVPTAAITATPGTPVVDAADAVAVLEFADERSVVQTRFATTTLALLRASIGHDLAPVAADARKALEAEPDSQLVGAEQLTFLGRGWTVGLAHEAASKLREAAGAWTESYPALEYRHGPISITGAGRPAWMFGKPPVGLVDDVARTGGSFVIGELDPMAELVRAQRVAVEMAAARGLDPDNPRHLTRSVILSGSRAVFGK